MAEWLLSMSSIRWFSKVDLHQVEGSIPFVSIVFAIFSVTLPRFWLPKVAHLPRHIEQGQFAPSLFLHFPYKSHFALHTYIHTRVSSKVD